MRPVVVHFQGFRREQKGDPDRSGAKLERDTRKRERRASWPASPRFIPAFGALLAACLLVEVLADRWEQPCTAARLKGSISEFELGVLRSLDAARSKAR
jgi:hypothetical protein